MIQSPQLKMYCTSSIFKVICHCLFAVSWHYLMILFTLNFRYCIDCIFKNITSHVHLYVHVQLSSSDVEAYILITQYVTNSGAMVNHCIFSRRQSFYLVKLTA